MNFRVPACEFGINAAPLTSCYPHPCSRGVRLPHLTCVEKYFTLLLGDSCILTCIYLAFALSIIWQTIDIRHRRPSSHQVNCKVRKPLAHQQFQPLVISILPPALPFLSLSISLPSTVRDVQYIPLHLSSPLARSFSLTLAAVFRQTNACPSAFTVRKEKADRQHLA